MVLGGEGGGVCTQPRREAVHDRTHNPRRHLHGDPCDALLHLA